MTAGGRAGHGSGADLPPLLLGRNMPKARAGGAEEARPESAERKGSGRPRAGGVSTGLAERGGRLPGIGCVLRFPPRGVLAVSRHRAVPGTGSGGSPRRSEIA